MASMRTPDDVDAVESFETVPSVMRTHVAAVEVETTLRAAARSLRTAGVGTLAIMDGPEIVGVVSERDLVRALADGSDVDQVRVGSVMSRDPRYLTIGDSVGTALEVMVDAHVRHLPVVDEGELVGMVSIRDVARSLLGGGEQR